jgi:hypothetical protein
VKIKHSLCIYKVVNDVFEVKRIVEQLLIQLS